VIHHLHPDYNAFSKPNNTMTKTNIPWIKLLLTGLVLIAATRITARADDFTTRPKPTSPPPPPVGSQLTGDAQR